MFLEQQRRSHASQLAQAWMLPAPPPPHSTQPPHSRRQSGCRAQLLAPVLHSLRPLLPCRRRAEHAINTVWAKLTTMLYYPVQIEGLENLPPINQPAVYVSNHQSFLVRCFMISRGGTMTRQSLGFPGSTTRVCLQDIYTLFHLHRDFKFISKTSNFLIPIIGWSMFLTGEHIAGARQTPTGLASLKLMARLLSASLKHPELAYASMIQPRCLLCCRACDDQPRGPPQPVGVPEAVRRAAEAGRLGAVLPRRHTQQGRPIACLQEGGLLCGCQGQGVSVCQASCVAGSSPIRPGPSVVQHCLGARFLVHRCPWCPSR